MHGLLPAFTEHGDEMRVLVACEFSGRVRDAFARRGHDAWSCDLLPSEGIYVSRHYQGDVTRWITSGMRRVYWDLVVAFPPCTYLSTVGARHFPKWRESGVQQQAIDFFMLFPDVADRVAIENPRGIMSTLYRKPDQEVQPWMFGDPWTKRTCLWLKNLPELRPTSIVQSNGPWVDGGTMNVKPKTAALGDGYEGASRKSGSDRVKGRCRTFEGIADAMAEQWGSLG